MSDPERPAADASSAGTSALDVAFDRLLPLHVQRMARLHWTPAEVVRKALALFQPADDETFLDVGSGPGKFCVIASLLSRASFCGIERSASLVEIAETCARTLQAPNVKFLCGDAFAMDWSGFAGVYLYNPFEEPMFGGAVEETREASARRTTERLRRMRVGTRVVLHHAFGGEMPDGYVRRWTGVEGSGVLELWTKERG